jgi:15-cis-phytoene synthase
MTRAAIPRASVAAGRAAIARHSRSFALASRLLPRTVRDRAVIVYAWCRRADDAVDAPGADAGAAVARLGRELTQIYAGERSSDPVLDGFAAIVREAGIPQTYPAELVAGMAMDAAGERYDTERALRRYCFRVAGVVGLMMSHVMCLADPDALAAAARLGIAMQLTNICRDVREDWERGRLYIPSALLENAGGRWLVSHVGGPLSRAASRPLARAIAWLLERASEDYRAADRGMASLPPSCRPAIAVAGRIYAAIGDEIARAGHDVLAPRAVVPKRRKLALAALAASAAAWSAVRARGPQFHPRELPELRFEDLA